MEEFGAMPSEDSKKQIARYLCFVQEKLQEFDLCDSEEVILNVSINRRPEDFEFRHLIPTEKAPFNTHGAHHGSSRC